MKRNFLILISIFFLCPFYGQGENSFAVNNFRSTYDFLFSLDNEISKNPYDDKLYHKRALIYLSLNEFEKALNDINRAINLNGNADDYFYTRSMIYYFKGYYQNALENIIIACDLKKCEKNLYFKSLIYDKMGDYRKAIFTINEILAMNPSCDYCYLQKALWAHKLNMYYEEILNYLYYLAVSNDLTNKNIINKKLKEIKRDEYFRKLYRAARAEIKVKGYPWNQ